MSPRFVVPDIPPLLEIDREHRIEVEGQYASEKELRLRAVMRHVGGEERVIESSPRHPVEEKLIERFALAAWREGQHSVQFQLLEGEKVIYTSPAQHYK